MKVQLYSRPNCGLCEEAKLILGLAAEDFQFEIEEINIEEDDALHETYMLRIPVIAREGKVIQEGNIDYPTLIEAFSE